MRTVRAVAAVLLSAVLMSACTADEAVPRSTEPRARVSVGLTEWSVGTSTAVTTSGEVILSVTNAGGTTHDLVVTGEAGRWATPHLSPGEAHELVIEAVPGEQLHLDCTLRGHHGQGMWTTLEVSESH